MHLAPLALLVAAFPGGQTGSSPSAPRLSPALAAEELLLHNAGLASTGPALVEFLRQRGTPLVAQDRLKALVRQLGDPSTAAADRAAGELIAIGAPALPLLRQAANSLDNPNVAERARHCLTHIEGKAASQLTLAVLHLLAVHRPAGAAEALLGCLPFVEEDRLIEEAQQTLLLVGARDGQPEPALLQALKDPNPLRRGVAAEVLCRLGDTSQHAPVRPLLQDPRPSVRLKAALALVQSQDAQAVPVLIDLLSELPRAQRRPAEEALARLAGDWAVGVPQGDDAISRRLRRDLWTAWWRGTDGAALLAELRLRTMSDADRDKILELVRSLDDGSAEVRELALGRLLEFGPRCVPLLRRAVHDGGGASGQRLVSYLERCLEALEKDAPPPLPKSAGRLLTLRRPEGTVAALLAYLPFVESADVSAEVRELIAVTAHRDGQADEAVVKGLGDRVASRRSAAAAALAQIRNSPHLGAVRQLLRDPDAEVRLATALALVERGDREAVPVLIALMVDLPFSQALEAEEYLGRLAQDRAPLVMLSEEAAGRTACRDAWNAWWRQQGPTVDLGRAEIGARALGYTLIVESYDPATRSGRVLELDTAGKPRWQVAGLAYPMYAQVLPGERLLVAEQGANRVSERDLAGKILWEHPAPAPFACQRLRNGQTFIACRQQISLVDKSGKEVMSYASPGDAILAAAWLRDGQMALVTYQGSCTRLDATGKPVKTFRVPFNPNFGINSAEVLPGDRVLVGVQNLNKITEYDADGKVVWEATLALAGNPHRLSNGRTLVAVGGNRIVELDRQGRLLQEMKDLPYRPWRVTRR
jgi:HEAT repeat protein